MTDAFENLHGLNPNDPTDGELDSDGDTLTNREEFEANTDPNNVDSDGDTFLDGVELSLKMDPNSPDERLKIPASLILNENCVVTALNRSVQVNPDGTFSFANMPSLNGFFRVRAVCDNQGQILVGQSDFLVGIPNGVVPVKNIVFFVEEPSPVSIALTSSASILDPLNTATQLTVTGTLPGDEQVDLTASSEGTSYSSSNPAFATVSAEGLVEAVASGNVIITARNEGAVGTLPIQVLLSDDTDGDGLPDDFENANATNPGGVNVSLLTGTIASAHDEAVGSEASNAIDGNSSTVWSAPAGGSPTFFEVTLQGETNVTQVRLIGDPAHPGGRVEFFQGTFQAFDALDNELFNSGEIQLPGFDPTIVVALNVTGAKRIRFTSTGAEGLQPSLAEFQVISGAGGTGLDLNNLANSALDPGNAADATVDFDGDGLSNLDEFTLGTSIFNADTDGDGLTDAQEGTLGSNPFLADSDNDGLTDSQEQALGTNFNLADTDGDGLADGVELRINLNPLSTDSDNDTILDGSEDTDGDGLVNIDEIIENTDPGNPDTDGDGINDFEEIVIGADGFITDPRRADTDGDGITDNVEIQVGLNPTDPLDADIDSDNDGVNNRDEIAQGTDPFSDAALLAVAQVDPANGERNISRFQSILIRFREPLRADALTTGTVTLSLVIPDGPDLPIVGTVSLSEDRHFISFKPTNGLPPINSDYLLVVSGFKGESGNSMRAPFQSTFSTGFDQQMPVPEVLGFSIPSGQPNVPVNSALVVDFTQPINPQSLTPSTFQVSLQGSPVAGTIQIEPDGKRVSFIPETSWNTGSSYTLTLTSSTFTGNLIKGLNDLNVSFGSGIGSLITTFDTSLSPDTVAPNLSEHFPGIGQTGIPLNGAIVLDFDEPLGDGLDFPSLVQLKIGTVRVNGSYALYNSNRRLIFTPILPLVEDSFYTVEIAAGIVDRSGNISSTPTSFTFQTGDTLVNERVTSLTQPTGDTIDVPPSTQIGLGLTDAFIPITVSEDTFSLWQFIPGTGTNTFVSVPGDIQLGLDRLTATLTPSSSLAPLSQYEVQISTVLDRTGRSPLLSFAGNRFTTGNQEDLIGPSVLLVSPPDGLSNVPVNPIVKVQLDEAVGLQIPPENLISVSTGGGSPIAGTTRFDADRKQIVFTPSVTLNADTQYTVAVDNFSDSAGNPSQPFSSTFSTSLSSIPDVVGPQVVTINPLDQAIDISENTTIVATFDELIDPISSLNIFGMQVTSAFTTEDASGTYSVSGTQATFTPDSSFIGGDTISVFIPNMGPDFIRDLAGNPLSTSFSSSFTIIGGGGGEDD